MINSLEVLDLPHSQSNWEVGKKIGFRGKNLLLIGDNGTGKSTMLDMVSNSLERRSQAILNGKNFQQDNPFNAFTEFFNEETWKVRPYAHDEREEEYFESEAYKDDSLYAFEIGIASVYGNGIKDIFNSGITCSEKQLTQAACDYVRNEENRIDFDKENYSHTFSHSESVDMFIDGAKMFAQKYNIDPEIVFGNVNMALQWREYPRDKEKSTGGHGAMDTDAGTWGHVKLEGNKGFLKSKRIVLDNSEPDGESLGERTRRIVGEIQEKSADKRGLIAILDEPTNGISPKGRAILMDEIFQLRKRVSIIAASNEDGFIDRAGASNDWIIFDLGDKKETEGKEEDAL